MTRKPIFVITATIFLLILAACASQASYDEAMSEPALARDVSGGDPGVDYYSEEPMMEGDMADDGSFAMNTAAQTVDIQVTQERLIIRTANMSLVVADTEAAMDTISRMAEDNGGWVVTSSVFQYNATAKTGNITIRVPSSGFNSAMEALRGMAVEVRQESTSGQDVTEEYVDLSARLENLEATAERVRGFLAEAETVEEALAVNQELSRLESEIEAMKGRLQYLSQSASFSTITVDLTPDIVAQPIEPTNWRPAVVFRNAVDSLVEALQDAAEFAIWFVIYLLPLLLIIGIPIWLVVLLVRFVWRRWRRRRNPVAVETVPAE
ncbi:MAG: DUF4349 domain-containing protein [Anaerolineales bacterium]|nr:DUF4349 domain-containing protein [Anaerolineales bacterium]